MRLTVEKSIAHDIAHTMRYTYKDCTLNIIKEEDSNISIFLSFVKRDITLYNKVYYYLKKRRVGYVARSYIKSYDAFLQMIENALESREDCADIAETFYEIIIQQIAYSRGV